MGNLNKVENLIKILIDLTNQFSGCTVEEIALTNNDDRLYRKNICNVIINNALERQLENGLDKKNSLRTLALKRNGKHRYDFKLFAIDFNELTDKNLYFKASQFYRFFKYKKIILAIFEIPDESNTLLKNYVFQGFKIIDFSDRFIEKNVRPVWDKMRYLIFSYKLKDIILKDKYGDSILTQSGVFVSAPNFPKTTEGVVFIRGGGTNARSKNMEINGIKMYQQFVWLRGDFIAEKMATINFI